MVMRIYKAMIWRSDNKPGERVSVAADSLSDARAQLEREYGVGTVFDLHNEEDASKPR